MKKMVLLACSLLVLMSCGLTGEKAGTVKILQRVEKEIIGTSDDIERQGCRVQYVVWTSVFIFPDDGLIGDSVWVQKRGTTDPDEIERIKDEYMLRARAVAQTLKDCKNEWIKTTERKEIVL
jgi:hypothetical protein